MDITKEQMTDSARFSNFAQRVKMAYWQDKPASKVPEIYLDEILLLAWAELRADREKVIQVLEEMKEFATDDDTPDKYVRKANTQGYNSGLSAAQEVLRGGGE